MANRKVHIVNALTQVWLGEIGSDLLGSLSLVTVMGVGIPLGAHAVAPNDVVSELVLSKTNHQYLIEKNKSKLKTRMNILATLEAGWNNDKNTKPIDALVQKNVLAILVNCYHGKQRTVIANGGEEVGTTSVAVVPGRVYNSKISFKGEKFYHYIDGKPAHLLECEPFESDYLFLFGRGAGNVVGHMLSASRVYSLKIYDYVYSLFGLDYSIELSTRPEDNFIGDIEVWNKAEAELKEVVEMKQNRAKDLTFSQAKGILMTFISSFFIGRSLSLFTIFIYI